MYPLSPSRQRPPLTLDQIAGHAQGIMLRVSLGTLDPSARMKAANSIVADRKRTKASQMPKIVNLVPQCRVSRRVHLGACSTACSKRKPLHFEGIRWNERRRGRRRRARRCCWRRAAARGRGTASLSEFSRAGHFLPIMPLGHEERPDLPWLRHKKKARKKSRAFVVSVEVGLNSPYRPCHPCHRQA